MSSILKHIEEKKKETQRLIGLNYEHLQQLIQNGERSHHEKLARIESNKIRIITGGGGRKPKLSIPEQIILTLVYLRHMTLRVTLVPTRGYPLTLRYRYRCEDRQLPATGNPSSPKGRRCANSTGLTTFQLLGIQFGVSKSTANDTFNYWVPILRELLPSSLIEQVKKTNLIMK